MALQVNYGDIRSEVIKKLEAKKDSMVAVLKNLDETMNTLPTVMQGDVVVAYQCEYEKVVQQIYSKLNVNLEKYVEQLESVCAEFEAIDKDMKDQLKV